MLILHFVFCWFYNLKLKTKEVDVESKSFSASVFTDFFPVPDNHLNNKLSGKVSRWEFSAQRKFPPTNFPAKQTKFNAWKRNFINDTSREEKRNSCHVKCICSAVIHYRMSKLVLIEWLRLWDFQISFGKTSIERLTGMNRKTDNVRNLRDRRVTPAHRFEDKLTFLPPHDVREN